MAYLCRAVPSALLSEVGPFLRNEDQYSIQLILEMTCVRHVEVVPSVHHVEVGQIPCLPHNTSVDGFCNEQCQTF